MQVRNLIRGLSPYPAAYTELVSESGERLQLKIYGAEFMDASAGIKPGQIVSDGKSYLGIGTADGMLSITDLQLGGKKRMDIGAFLLGFRNPQTWRCE